MKTLAKGPGTPQALECRLGVLVASHTKGEMVSCVLAVRLSEGPCPG